MPTHALYLKVSQKTLVHLFNFNILTTFKGGGGGHRRKEGQIYTYINIDDGKISQNFWDWGLFTSHYVPCWIWLSLEPVYPIFGPIRMRMFWIWILNTKIPDIWKMFWILNTRYIQFWKMFWILYARYIFFWKMAEFEYKIRLVWLEDFWVRVWIQYWCRCSVTMTLTMSGTQGRRWSAAGTPCSPASPAPTTPRCGAPSAASPWTTRRASSTTR